MNGVGHTANIAWVLPIAEGRMQSSQGDLFDPDVTRALLDQLLTDSRLYRTGEDYKHLLDFVVQLRNVAPFNAMLLQLQKPGLRFSASAFDWHKRFGRTIKDGARPLLILWPFGPVATVYDVQDTEGNELPEDVNCFIARGEIDNAVFNGFARKLTSKSILWEEFDGGDSKAGSIRVVRRADPDKEKDRTTYRMLINRNHDLAVRFVTLVHELGHLFLGHLGPEKALSDPETASLEPCRTGTRGRVSGLHSGREKWRPFEIRNVPCEFR